MIVYEKVADVIRSSRVIIITAGAGMSVDSGLPDFRGDRGFWRAYPLYERLGLNFCDMANPYQFERDPAFGWGFYGHRLGMYRNVKPHEGFYILLKWIDKLNLDYFVVTSNVDGHFQKAGFKDDRVYEVHGSIHYLQCLRPCSDDIWPNDEEVRVDYETMKALNIPRCRNCGGVARPNILMFGDYSWISRRTDAQRALFYSFLERNKGKPMVVIEIGAGKAIPTIRRTSEMLGYSYNTVVVRINPREPEINPPHVSIPERGLVALKEIDRFLNLD
ncbi:MAG: SIR2 family NAD-dependent protein deacylase [Thermosulfidibacteraceae bacterium]